MSTVAIKNTMVMNNTEKKAGLVERFKKYLLDNAEYFAVASAVMSGNGYAAGHAILLSLLFHLVHGNYDIPHK